MTIGNDFDPGDPRFGLPEPGPMFQGNPLWPLTDSSDTLLNHFLTPGDLGIFCGAAFVYLHTRRGQPTFFADAQPVVRMWEDRAAFRTAVLQFMDTLSKEAKAEAVRIWLEATGLAKKTEVASARHASQKHSAGGTKKKKKATTRAGASGGRIASAKRSASARRKSGGNGRSSR